jgi:transposase-like protein
VRLCGRRCVRAYGCGEAGRAKKLLTNLARRLRANHPGAAASLEKGLDETLTVMRFGLPRSLERVLSTTNAIENLIGSVRDLGRRVKRWRDARMIVRGLSPQSPTQRLAFAASSAPAQPWRSS